MKKIKLLCILILSLFVGGCNIIKTISLLKSGIIENKNYSEIIHFENRAGLMIINVEINEKQYDFIFDTGASTVISQDIANDLNFEIKSRVNSSDSQNNTEKNPFTTVPNLKIGTLIFSDIGAAVIDFNKIPEIKCMEIDGIIGANLMQLAKWQIDFQNNTLTASDKMIFPENSKNIFTLNFKTNVSGTPLIEVNLTGNITAKDVFFDTGMTQSLSLSSKYFYRLIDNYPNLQTVKAYGTNSVSAFGTSKDSVFYMKLPKISLNDLHISNTIVEFKGKNRNLIGNKMLKNYNVSIDWETKIIFLIQVKQPVKDSLISYGFNPIMKDNKLFVGTVFEKSPASDCGLKVDNQITSINDVDYSNITPEQYCEIIFNFINQKEPEIIYLRWKDSNGLLQNNSFKRIDLFIKK